MRIIVDQQVEYMQYINSSIIFGVVGRERTAKSVICVLTMAVLGLKNEKKRKITEQEVDNRKTGSKRKLMD